MMKMMPPWWYCQIISDHLHLITSLQQAYRKDSFPIYKGSGRLGCCLKVTKSTNGRAGIWTCILSDFKTQVLHYCPSGKFLRHFNKVTNGDFVHWYTGTEKKRLREIWPSINNLKLLTWWMMYNDRTWIVQHLLIISWIIGQLIYYLSPFRTLWVFQRHAAFGTSHVQLNRILNHLTWPQSRMIVFHFKMTRNFVP